MVILHAIERDFAYSAVWRRASCMLTEIRVVAITGRTYGNFHSFSHESLVSTHAGVAKGLA